MAFIVSAEVFSESLHDTVDIHKTNSFFDTLQIKAKNNQWTKELYNIVVNTPKGGKHKTVTSNITASPFEMYDGFLIRSVHIKKINIFGPEVYDTNQIPQNILEKSANRLHVKTANPIIRNHLLIKAGHYFDSKLLSENERILRDLPSINDNRIVVSSVDTINNTVDLNVIIKDVWSKGFGFETADFNDGRIDFWDRNILGTGHELDNIIFWDNTKPEKLGYEGAYRVKNMYGSFINTDLHYISAFDKKEFGIHVIRNIFSQSIKYAGGLEYLNSKQDQYIKNEMVNDTFHIDYELTDFWIARTFKVSPSVLNDYQSNIVLSLAYYNYFYNRTAPVEENFLYNYQDRAIVLGGMAFSSQNFFKTNYIYSFGRTEDMPIGFQLSFKSGFERNDFKDRYYHEINLMSGFYIPKMGYVFNRIDAGSFFIKPKTAEQGILRIKLNYFTNLHNVGQFRYRQFVNVNYTKGYNRYVDEHISINRKEGIRGFRSDLLNYDKKLVINFESVFFTPLYFYGFRFVSYLFADIAFTGPDEKSVFSNKPYSGIGIGLRIRNDHLVFRTIQIQFGYYPKAPADMDRFKGTMSGEPRLRPENFYVKEPEIFMFK